MIITLLLVIQTKLVKAGITYVEFKTAKIFGRNLITKENWNPEKAINYTCTGNIAVEEQKNVRNLYRLNNHSAM